MLEVEDGNLEGKYDNESEDEEPVDRGGLERKENFRLLNCLRDITNKVITNKTFWNIVIFVGSSASASLSPWTISCSATSNSTDNSTISADNSIVQYFPFITAGCGALNMIGYIVYLMAKNYEVKKQINDAQEKCVQTAWELLSKTGQRVGQEQIRSFISVLREKDVKFNGIMEEEEKASVCCLKLNRSVNWKWHEMLLDGNPLIVSLLSEVISIFFTITTLTCKSEQKVAITVTGGLATCLWLFHHCYLAPKLRDYSKLLGKKQGKLHSFTNDHYNSKIKRLEEEKGRAQEKQARAESELAQVKRRLTELLEEKQRRAETQSYDQQPITAAAMLPIKSKSDPADVGHSCRML